MISSIAIIFISVMIALLEIPKLKKENAIREMIVFSFFLLNGTVFGVLSALRIKIPNPVDWLIVIFEPISTWIERLLT